MGRSVSGLAPLVVETVPSKVRNQQSTIDAFLNQRWTQDVQRHLSTIGWFEFFQLVDILEEIDLAQEEHVHVWQPDISGQYTIKSAYRAFFNGPVTFEPWRHIWKTQAPAKCKIFLWLAVRKMCWTSDRLAKRNLPHPTLCPLCDQEEEHIQHILTTCVFAREFWFRILTPVGCRFACHLRMSLLLSSGGGQV